MRRGISVLLAVLVMAGVVLLGISPAAFAQDSYNWELQEPPPSEDSMYGVSAVDEDHVWAVSYLGGIFFYDGVSWTADYDAPALRLNDVFALDDSHVWTVGNDGNIFFYDGSGWTSQKDDPPITSEDLYGVHFSEHGGQYYGWAVGVDGTRLYTDDGGENWYDYSIIGPSAENYDYKSVGTFIEESVMQVCVVGDDYDHVATIVYQGFDTGTGPVLWSAPSATPAAVDLNDVDLIDADEWWAVGDSGSVWKTDDGGDNWESADNPAGTDLNGITCLDASHMWAAGRGGQVIFSDGTGWESQYSDATLNLQDITAADASQIWAVGYDDGTSGVIRHAADGSTWTGQTCPSSRRLGGVSAVTPSEVWAVGDPMAPAYYYDGSAWADMSSNHTLNYWGVSALDSSHVWAVSDMGGRGNVDFFDGTEWETGESGTTETLYAVDALDATHVWAVGGGGAIAFYDGDWAIQGSPGSSELKDVSACDASNVWAVGPGHTVYYFDGNDWTDLTGDVPSEVGQLNGVCATAPDDVWAVDDGGRVIHYDGISWEIDRPGDGTILRGVAAMDASHVWAVGSEGAVVFYDGTGWEEQVTPTTRDLYGVTVSRGQVWATGELGTIVHGAGPAPTVTSIDPESGTNDGTVEIEDLAGTSFENGATVKLRKSGQSDIIATGVTVEAAGRISCDFDLEGAATGAWDVVVTNPDMQSATLAGGFSIEYPAPSITSISPVTAPNSGVVQINSIRGTGFRAGTNVELQKDGQSDIKALNTSVESSTKISCYFDLTGAATGEWDVYVENTDGKSAVKTGAFEITSASSTWYLAEGSTAWGYQCYITIENPNSESVTADITYNTDTGAVDGGTLNLPASSQTTINPAETLGSKDFSTHVECNEGKTIAVDRTMSWPPLGTGAGEAPKAGAGISGDGHCSVGVTSPATTWYLPEGSSAWGFECWHLVQNPNRQDAHLTLTYMVEGGEQEVRTRTVPAGSRATYDMNVEIGLKDASLRVESDLPVIAERAMYRNDRREGHDSIGTTTPCEDFYLAEGTTAWGFTTYVLVQNPQVTETTVNITYMTSAGPVSHPDNPIVMPASSRRTIRVNDYLSGSDFSTLVSGSQPIIAERAMYWGDGTAQGEACHDSIGLSSPHRAFYLPDGQTTDGRETWTLVQNPNNEAVEVEITYLTPDGKGNVTVNETVPANSRSTFSMADAGIQGRAAVMVECLSPGKKIMAERAMYWDSRGAGTNTVGAHSD